MESGIYIIKNVINNKVYVGSTKNFTKRWHQHLTKLRAKSHSSIKLQRSFDKHGENSFVFEIIEYVSYTKTVLMERENYYISFYNSKKFGYNIADASFGDVLTNHPNKKDIIKRRMKSLADTKSRMSKEELSKTWGKFGKKNGMFGKTHTEETRAKISEANIGHSRSKGRICSAETKQKMSIVASQRTGDKNPFYGKTHTDEFKEASRQKMLGKKPANTKIIIIDGIEYYGSTEASIATGILPSTITYRIRSHNVLYKDYLYNH